MDWQLVRSTELTQRTVSFCSGSIKTYSLFDLEMGDYLFMCSYQSFDQSTGNTMLHTESMGPLGRVELTLRRHLQNTGGCHYSFALWDEVTYFVMPFRYFCSDTGAAGG